MIVGDGSGDPVAESGATLRTSIGVGTGDTLSISGLTLSTDLSVANGGTGASTLTANGVLIGNGTSAIGAVDMSTKGHVLIGDGSGNPQMLAVGCNAQILTACSGETTGVKWAAAAAGGPAQATQAAVEAETNEDTYIPPDLIRNSPGVAKAWVSITGAGARNTPYYNVSSITDTDTGDRTIVFDTDFSGVIYVGADGHFDAAATFYKSSYSSIAAGSVRLRIFNAAGATVDIETTNAFYGDQ
jgi:hypothetical protein